MIPRLLSAGVVVVDVLCGPVDRLPEPGGLELIDGLSLEVGGNAANVATAYALLGGPTRLCACVGNDPLGDFVVNDLIAANVDCTHLRRDSTLPTASTVVVVDSAGERSFLHCPGANRDLRRTDIEAALSDVAGVVIAGAGLVPGLHGTDLLALAQLAREQRVVTFLDAVLNPSVDLRDVVVPALRAVDWFVPSAVEAELITGFRDPWDQVAGLVDLGARGVVVKCGTRGCVGLSPDGERIDVAAFDTVCVDSLGAGDAWVAGFARGIMTDRSAADSARCANRVGADCVSGRGARTALVPWEDVESRISNGIP